MKTWQAALINPQTTLREALQVIDRTGGRIALVVDARRQLLGTLSDGDIRRGLLKGLGLADVVALAMHEHPTSARVDDDRASVLAQMRRLGFHQMPVVDAENRVVGMQTLDDFLAAPVRDNWVVIMAGGLGTRLSELTQSTPKPMLRVGSRPLLETIVRNLADQGFSHLFLAVNYMADQIEAHFDDGGQFGVEIRYLREPQRLGTAGALGLLPNAPTAPVIVINADLLTKEDFGQLLDRHVLSGAEATMAVRNYEMQVPFGVVREREGTIEAIEEKPVQRFLVNAGIYVLSPQALQKVQAGEYLDMPTLFQRLVDEGCTTRCCPITGFWLDIGRLGDYERANDEFGAHFR